MIEIGNEDTRQPDLDPTMSPLLRAVVRMARRLKGDDTFAIDPSLTTADILGFAFRRTIMALRGLWLSVRTRRWVFPVFVGRGARITGARHLRLSPGVTIDDYCRLDCLGKRGISLGRGATLRRGAHIEVTSVMRQLGEGAVIGERVGISEGCFIGAKGLVSIGDDTIIGPGTRIIAENHVFASRGQSIMSQGVTRCGIDIGADCWLGASVVVLDSVSIGEGSVIGAGAVVNRSSSPSPLPQESPLELSRAGDLLVRILFVNKFGFARGGQERVVFDEIDWLRQRGHDAELFTTAHPDNMEWRYADKFPVYREIGAAGAADARAVRDMFWNGTAGRAIEAVIADYRPDVVHFHGIHRHLSPSVVSAAKRAGVRTVMTLHDYWPICPGNVLLRRGSTVCDPVACGRSHTAAMAHKCVQGSFARSALAATELSWQRATGAYERSLDALISPSRFLRDTVRSKGFSARRFEIVPNAVPPVPVPGEPSEPPSVLYAGRLSTEKGLSVLIDAAKMAEVRLVIAGTGPLRDLVTDLPGVEYVGMLDSDEMARARERTIAAVVPSLWYENAPMAILESMGFGRPVVGTAIGGTPELVRHEVDGLLVAPGDVRSLAAALGRIVSDRSLASAMGSSGRQRVTSDFSPERHCRRLLAVYEDRPLP